VRIDTTAQSSMTTVISSPDGNDDPASLSMTSLLQLASGYAGTTMDVRTNTSGQIRHRSSASGLLTIATIGWVDRRGRDD